MGWRKLVTLLGRRPTFLMLYLIFTLLMWLGVSTTKGKKAIDVRSSLALSIL